MTTQQKKPISSATPQELRDFGELVLQLDIPASAKPLDVVAQIKTAWPSDFIFVDEAELEPAAETQTDQARAEAKIKVLTGASKDDPKWLVRIASTELPGGQDDVQVGVNGPVALIKRDVEVEIPHRYILALQNAVRIGFTRGEGRGELVPSKIIAYPFEVIDKPSRQEIEAWHERTKDLVLA